MAFHTNQYRNWDMAGGVSGRPPWSSAGAMQWQQASKHWSTNYPGGSKGCHICAGCNGQAKHHVRPQKTHQHVQRAPAAAAVRPMNGEDGSQSFLWGKSWVILGLVIFVALPHLIAFIVAWTSGHIKDPVLPFISELHERQPERSIFGTLLTIGVLFAAAAIYVRYRQVDAYMHDGKTVANKLALLFGLLTVLGMLLIAHFTWSTDYGLFLTRFVSAQMIFIFGWLYCLTQIGLTYRTLRQLSSVTVLWIRIILTIIHTAGFVALYVITWTDLYKYEPIRTTPGVNDDWRRASSATQWVIVMSIIIFFLTYFNEFRYIKIIYEVSIKQRKMAAPIRTN